MMGKNEASSNINDIRVKTMAEKMKKLEDNSAKIRARVRKCFEQLSCSLKLRERQLLRQIEAVHNQQLSIIQSNSEDPSSVASIMINLNYHENLEETILKFGRVELSDKESILVKDAEPYKVEDYEEASRDHISFDKSIEFEKDTNLIINLHKKINLNTNRNITNVLSVASDNFNINPQIIENFSETVSDNCSILCSSLLERSMGIIYDSEYNLRLNTSYDNLCSSDTIIDDSSNGVTTVVEVILDSEKHFKSSQEEEKLDESTNGKYVIDIRRLDNSNNDTSCEHPKQIQQWLEEILVETETEPMVHETEQLVGRSESQCRKFHVPLKI